MGAVNKSLIEIDGITVIDHQLRVLRKLFHTVITVGWPQADPLPEGLSNVSDNYPGIGPVAGIEAALKAAQTDMVFIFGSDMPWLSEEIITMEVRTMGEKPGTVLVPRVGSMIEPLHAVYCRTLHGRLEDAIKRKSITSVREFIFMSSPVYLDLPERQDIFRAFTNINSPGDLLVR